eukprot:CAMPEP_0206459184 /NCGR_PEP_ID=MMETSP0324_2-20121206/24026_1 /ASSEMBLY_ACC=CAM_ASM_000836 /TAXON_ID=2866 /ORGANISM="Crypthecodinium cohnii, Strain Seligo" /LENGTH=350 /DNA_ID=CAMNT_0053930689 /DNA_START=67 /DNA_END=1119 /DNA_ORIENTATION=+
MPQWGDKIDGKEVVLRTLRSDSLEVDVTNFGATLSAVRVLNKSEWIDVLLGYESLDRYLQGGKPNFSSAVGRCANRIAGGTFDLDGHTYTLEKNNGPNHLHGGTKGFWQEIFEVVSYNDNSITLSLFSPDGHMGYPGNLQLYITYEVRGNELHFSYEGKTDQATLLNLTNHGYWNLKGHHAGTILDHKLMVNASHTTAVDENLTITGELNSLKGTAADLREDLHLISDVVDQAGPLDANYCLTLEGPDASEKVGSKAGELLAARVEAPNGISMEVWTDQPGIQVYTGNFVGLPEHPDTWHGKGAKWHKFSGLCLEPQLWPDGIHHKNFPSPILRPDETYRQHSWHVFSTQ